MRYFSVCENMIEFFICPVLSFLLLGNMLIALYYVDKAENVETKELQKIVNQCLKYFRR